MSTTFFKKLLTAFPLRTACLLLSAFLLTNGAKAQFNYITNSKGTITITQYTDSGGDVTIPDTINDLPVTAIGQDAFFQSYGLTSVTMGSNITTIGTNAIFQCPNLSTVTIPGTATNIGTGPFIDCLSLTTISLTGPNPNYTVSNNILFNAKQNQLIEFPGGVGGSYTLPAGITNVGQGFIGNSLTAIAVDTKNIYYSGSNGVLFNKKFTQLVEYPGAAPGSYIVPSTVTIVVSASFEYSVGVSSVSIGTPVTSIGLFAFYDCSALTNITVNPTNSSYSSINGVLFDKKQTQLIQFPSGMGGNYIVPETVDNIGGGAFGDSLTLTDAVIPNSVTNIGEEAFYSCESLTNITLGSGIVSIGQNAFFSCFGLTDLVIPGSVTNIGEEAFAGCENVTNVCFEGNQPFDGGSIFSFDNDLSTILYVSGTAGWGATYDGIPTTPCATCGVSAPLLSIVQSGPNVILTWSADFSGYGLQSTTNLLPRPAWGAVSPLPVIVNGENTVTNPIIGTRQFYRLSQ